MTGRENLAFIARIYGRNYRELLDFVEDFAEIGSYMQQPVRTYSSGMKARLSFGVSMAIQFDYYLIDEVIAVGDLSFKRKSQGCPVGAAQELDRLAGLPQRIDHEGVLPAWRRRGRRQAARIRHPERCDHILRGLAGRLTWRLVRPFGYRSHAGSIRTVRATDGRSGIGPTLKSTAVRSARPGERPCADAGTAPSPLSRQATRLSTACSGVMNRPLVQLT